MRHKTTSYELTKYSRHPNWVRAAGVVNEIQGLVLHDIPNLGSRLEGNSPWAFQVSDLLANEDGISEAVNEISKECKR